MVIELNSKAKTYNNIVKAIFDTALIACEQQEQIRQPGFSSMLVESYNEKDKY